MNYQCLDLLDFGTLLGNATGLERESLRVTTAGRIATTDHPRAIGHKLTHPRVTVDFSEGLLELVTAPHRRREGMLAELAELHRFVGRHLPDDEMLWPMSMPPQATPDEVRIAEFGGSLSGRMKEVYRQGLASRYGRIMQVIAGVHFNFSLDARFMAHMHGAYGQGLDEQECANRVYFRLVRGFDRIAWLLPYLFGASPVAARTSVSQHADWLQPLDDGHLIGEFATSLRMSDIGYTSPAQADLFISHSTLQDYVRELVAATSTPWPAYEALGVRDGAQWRQLNGNVLQIENEYYSAIRPKQLVELGERPACALLNRGVRYVEVRLLDVDPFEPLGIAAQTADFMEVFLLACLATGNAEGNCTRQDKTNLQQVVREGRRPGLLLVRDGAEIALTEWAGELLDLCAELARRLDAAAGTDRYARAVAAQAAKLADPARLPSQRVADQAGSSDYAAWVRGLARRYTDELRTAAGDMSAQAELKREAEESFAEAEAVEREQCCSLSFEDYVAHYFDSLCGAAVAS